MIRANTKKLLSLVLAIALLCSMLPLTVGAQEQENAVQITKQPESVLVEAGKTVSVSFEAEGDGLTYKWYYADEGDEYFSRSSSTGNTYSTPMAEHKDGRQVYCVVTDQYGNKVQTEIATIGLFVPPVLTITQEPQAVQALNNERVYITAAASSEEVTYKWYYKDAGEETFKKSSVTSNTYNTTMTETKDGRQVYCVITDQYGQKVTTGTATMTLRVPQETVITAQPQSAVFEDGQKVSISFAAEGEGLRYRWYYADKGAETFKRSSFNGTTYATLMAAHKDGRRVYCVITDQFGNKTTTNIVAMTLPQAEVEPVIPGEGMVAVTVPEAVDYPIAGTAYKFFLEQKTRGETLYLTGEMDGHYYATTTNAAEAADVYMEETVDGYYLYILKDGARKYLEIVQSGTYTNVVFVDEPTTTLQWNAEIGSFTCDVEGTANYFGTYSSFSTFSASKISFVTGSNAANMDVVGGSFVARLGTLKEVCVSMAELAFQQLQKDYPATSTPTTTDADYTRKNVYTVEGQDVPVVWTADSDNVVIEDNGDGTVTVKVTKGEEAVNYTLTATIAGTYTSTYACAISALPVVDPDAPASTTVNTVIADYADANSWSNGVQYPTITMDSNITVTATGGGNTGKYYTSGENWRIYQNETPSVTVTAASGNIVSVKVTYVVQNTGVLTLNGSQIASDSVVSVNAPSVTFSVGNTGTEAKGQVRITAIEVVYAAESTGGEGGGEEPVVNAAEQAFAQLQADYPASDTVITTDVDYTRKNVYTVSGEDVTVEWTTDSDNAAVLDNGDGTVTVEITRGESDEEYTLTATIIGSEGNYTASWDCLIPAAETEEPGEEPEPGVPTTLTVSIGDCATANGWADSTKYLTAALDENVTVTMTGGTNTGKYYTSNTSWRVYQNENPTITVAAEGKTIVSVKITYAVKNSGVLTLDGSNITSGTVVDVNASSVTFSVGNTGTKTNGNIQITAIEVIYS